LRVVRRGNAFLITSRDHANELFGEKLEKQRQLIEIQKLREAPAKPPAPPAPEKPPEKAPPFGRGFNDVFKPEQFQNLSPFPNMPFNGGPIPFIPGRPLGTPLAPGK
jgi:hypothetical protein